MHLNQCMQNADRIEMTGKKFNMQDFTWFLNMDQELDSEIVNAIKNTLSVRRKYYSAPEKHGFP